jgi:hypothetical protein
MKNFLWLNLLVLLILAVLAFGDVSHLVAHLMGLVYLYFSGSSILSGKQRGIILFSSIAVWICFVANAFLEHDLRRSMVLLLVIALAFLICAGMLLATFLMNPRSSSTPSSDERAD